MFTQNHGTQTARIYHSLSLCTCTMGDGGWDPCECICSHNGAMRRLLSLVRGDSFVRRVPIGRDSLLFIFSFNRRNRLVRITSASERTRVSKFLFVRLDVLIVVTS